METIAVRDDAKSNWLDRFVTRTTAIPLPRDLRSKGLRTVVTLVSVAFSLLYIYYAGFGYFSPESFISGYLGFTFVLVFILFPGSDKSPRDRITAVDGVLVLSTIAVTYHYNVYFPIRYIERFGEALVHDVVFGIMAIVLALEACRRTLGPALPLISLALIGYSLFGPYFPGHLTHQGISVWDTAAWLYSNQSIYGVITRIFASFVFLFIVFGAILEMSGGKELFLNLPLSIIGRTRGGSAKLSAVASALFGMISGSPTANIVGTGTLTIPLMKRSGFPPHVSAAFEATASTIGVTMPPLMGAAIFLMADFTGIPYLEIVKVSIPAVAVVHALPSWRWPTCTPGRRASRGCRPRSWGIPGRYSKTTGPSRFPWVSSSTCSDRATARITPCSSLFWEWRGRVSSPGTRA